MGVCPKQPLCRIDTTARHRKLERNNSAPVQHRSPPPRHKKVQRTRSDALVLLVSNAQTKGTYQSTYEREELHKTGWHDVCGRRPIRGSANSLLTAANDGRSIGPQLRGQSKPIRKQPLHSFFTFSTTKFPAKVCGPRAVERSTLLLPNVSASGVHGADLPPGNNGYVMDLLPEAENASVQREQPQLSYFGYLTPSRERMALRQLLRPSEDAECEQFTTTRLLSHEPQGNTGVSVGYSKQAISTDKWMDCCTCMCCVKALFYHCTKDDDECHVDVSTDPCSCQGSGAECAGRWGILGVLSMCMPCLLCYPMFQAANHVRRK